MKMKMKMKVRVISVSRTVVLVCVVVMAAMAKIDAQLFETPGSRLLDVDLISDGKRYYDKYQVMYGTRTCTVTMVLSS